MKLPLRGRLREDSAEAMFPFVRGKRRGMGVGLGEAQICGAAESSGPRLGREPAGPGAHGDSGGGLAPAFIHVLSTGRSGLGRD